MSNLGIKEIVLLNCFNYLNVGNQQNKRLGRVVDKILADPKKLEELISKNSASGRPASVKEESWKNILKLIQKNENLRSLTIRQQSSQMGYDPKGLNAVCFLDEKNKEATFVFRGTGRGEWLDNGIAFSEKDSPQQKEALEYFEKSAAKLGLEEKGYNVVVTGHSKGGNKA